MVFVADEKASGVMWLRNGSFEFPSAGRDRAFIGLDSWSDSDLGSAGDGAIVLELQRRAERDTVSSFVENVAQRKTFRQRLLLVGRSC